MGTEALLHGNQVCSRNLEHFDTPVRKKQIKLTGKNLLNFRSLKSSYEKSSFAACGAQGGDNLYFTVFLAPLEEIIFSANDDRG